MSRDSLGRTFGVAATLCLICSLLVSAAAVGLRPIKQANRQRDRQMNILSVVGLYDRVDPPSQPVSEIYREKITAQVIDLSTGEVLPESDPEKFDSQQAAADPQTSVEIPANALPGFKRREAMTVVYRVEQDGRLEQLILPIYGKGLWSTLYGFLALDADLTTIRGITFYQHGETPGLGGEIENPQWQEIWDGKLAFDEQGNVEIEVIKGAVGPGTSNAEHKIDGLSGATITSRGVSDLVRYWLGEHGFGPYLDRLRQEG